MDVRPTCMFCHQRFSLRPGEPPTACGSWRSLDGAHVERRVATPEQRARMKLDTVPDMIFETSTLMDPDEEPIWSGPAMRKPANNMRGKAKPASPTPFDADALRAGKPRTGQEGLL